MLREGIPGGGRGFPKTGELVDAIVQPAAHRVIAEFAAAHRDDRKLGGQAAVPREVEERRDQFPPRQVTGGAENDEHSRIEAVSGFHEANISVVRISSFPSKPDCLWRLNTFFSVSENGGARVAITVSPAWAFSGLPQHG